ncbi:isochorismatase family protein [Alkalibacterium olivapovliticus]|uniref:Nicotinamidase-related amidase n=1 Tax=Alkalibacterium olivapovliticus TaxID=99907 RepID=A0A2T0VTA4_9LACT|nr:isochorismatase family protein [Alkalibacterium olivapovliticus]PRY74221.1 nicotinamidase-related amidase [Alkalibacterium olivapovliticus]
MKALIILDAQKGIIERKDFNSQLDNIHKLIDQFQENGDLVLATRHIDKEEGSLIYHKSDKSNIEEKISEKISSVFDKETPNIFKETEITKYLTDNDVRHVFFTGFNAEYCCLFSSIGAETLGYKVTYIEDASGTVNDGETYEMENIDVVDFVGCILDWSGIVEVLYYDEYREKYS